MHRESDRVRAMFRRLVGGFAVASVLALPMVLALLLSVLWPATGSRVLGAASLVMLFSVILLTLLWLLVVLPFVGALADHPPLSAVLVMAAWTFNASIVLRGARLMTLLLWALGLAVVQCVLLVGWSR